MKDNKIDFLTPVKILNGFYKDKVGLFYGYGSENVSVKIERDHVLFPVKALTEKVKTI